MNNDNAERVQQDEEIKKSLSNIKNKFLVMSGKGGVGKSSVSVNIAVGLANLGYKVGLMDVDLHGPSIPQMLGLKMGSIKTVDEKMIPVSHSENLSVISIECMIDSIESPLIWRGPMKTGIIKQFLSDVKWGDLDYLIIDAPPGTGDEPLTVAQTITDAKAVIVTTPQNVSLRDVRKSINFCKKVNMVILGLIENMSGFICPSCNEKIDLFKTGGGEKVANDMNIDYFGSIPIIPSIVTSCDNGIPAIAESTVVKEAFEPILNSISQKINSK